MSYPLFPIAYPEPDPAPEDAPFTVEQRIQVFLHRWTWKFQRDAAERDLRALVQAAREDSGAPGIEGRG